MIWDDLLQLHPLKINIGGGRCHHPVRKYRQYVSIDRRPQDPPRHQWSVFASMPCEFHLPDNCVDAAMTEHFVEHLTELDGISVMREVHRVLKHGAMFRIAVPDMLHPKHAAELAAGKNSVSMHKSLWTYQRLSAALVDIGFHGIEIQCYADHCGVYHERPISHWQHGWIVRCPKNDARNQGGMKYGQLEVTSLIVDAYKCPSGSRVAKYETGKATEWMPE